MGTYITVPADIYRDRQILTFNCYFGEALHGSMEENAR